MGNRSYLISLSLLFLTRAVLTYAVTPSIAAAVLDASLPQLDTHQEVVIITLVFGAVGAWCLVSVVWPTSMFAQWAQVASAALTAAWAVLSVFAGFKGQEYNLVLSVVWVWAAWIQIQAIRFQALLEGVDFQAFYEAVRHAREEYETEGSDAS